MSKHPLPPLFVSLISWACVPIALYQGIKVRKKSGRMAPALGPLYGVAGEENKNIPHISLLVIGDSSAAAVGAEHTNEGLAAQLAKLMATQTNTPVHWLMAGANSATSGQVLNAVLPYLERKTYSHIVITLGTNDAKNFNTVSRFKRDFGDLLYATKAKFPDATIIWSPPIDMTSVPALPPMLAFILNLRRGLIHAKGAQLCAERYTIAASPLVVEDKIGFAADGFHANQIGYGAWAAHLLPFLLKD